MKVVMLAAGVGRRLHGDENNPLPKALLEFGGKTLLARHIECLHGNGIDELVMIVGHRREDLLAEIDAVAPDGFVRTLFNPRYKESPILSLGTADEVLRGGDDVLFMDADVLYHPDVLARLIQSGQRNCFTIDYEFEAGDEPVKLCLRDGVLVDFGKQVTGDYHKIGEWPGFMRMSAGIAAKVADAVQTHVDDDNLTATYETAMCDVLVSEPAGTFGYEDITGIPWTEIDFPADVIYAEDVILPRILESLGEASKTAS
jgi:choline kinase